MPLHTHFLNVGQGDCTIIEFPSGRVGMVDIYNLRVLDPHTKQELLEAYHESLAYQRASKGIHDLRLLDDDFIRRKEQELTDPLAYYDAHIGAGKDIFRMIITHPDMDHMTGLYRIHSQDVRKNILNFWHVGNDDFNLAGCTDEDWGTGPFDKRDWETYQSLRKSSQVPKALNMYRGHSGEFWTEDGVELWAPTAEITKEAVAKNESNIISMVLKISYKGRSILLGGDATATETWPAIYRITTMSGIDVLKASHHGRKTGYHQQSVKEMSPWLTITSVGAKEHDATPRYRQYSNYTVSLRDSGDIKITITDEGKLIYPSKIEEHWKPKSS